MLVRARSVDKDDRGADGQASASASAKGLKPHQVHELAEAEIRESERLPKALGISKDYEGGSHWRKQDERLREANLERGKEDGRRAGA